MPTSDKQSRAPDIVLIFDGGSHGNPGWGYGSCAIQRVSHGAQRLERLELGDDYTNNEAEYDTLIAALEDLIRRLGAAARRAPAPVGALWCCHADCATPRREYARAGSLGPRSVPRHPAPQCDQARLPGWWVNLPVARSNAGQHR